MRDPVGPLPIEDYGVIGDLHSVALVGKNGSIDWFCYPHFDSPSVFARILDPERGGHFQITPLDDFSSHQFYVPETNVLVTRFATEGATAELTDFMPISLDDERHRQHRLIRRLRVLSGRPRFEMRCKPAFDYARADTRTRRTSRGVEFFGAKLRLRLRSNRSLSVDKGTGRSVFTATADEDAVFILEEAKHADECPSCYVPIEGTHASLAYTTRFWRDWASQCVYRGRWREHVLRSALILKLLTYQPTGAMVAAPTTSLPESVGGERNWDYRFTWFRDAGFVVYALLRIGFHKEARAFIEWVETHGSRKRGDRLRPLYPIDKDGSVKERALDLAGYRGSRPVRVGNKAYDQFQLDVYGAILDAVYLYNKHAVPISMDVWEWVAPMLDWLCKNWQREDRSIWEVRGTPQRFTYSMVMSWVALDRGLRIAKKRSFPGDLETWRRTRDEIQRTVFDKCWNPRKKAFTQAPDNDALDASLLLMPLVFFVGPRDRRFRATLEAIRRKLVVDPLVYRYEHGKVSEGVTGPEGAFVACSFWLVEALTRAGDVEDAHRLFEGLLAHTNHLGLLPEELGAGGDFLGNFPLALSHLALISAAVNLDRRLGR